MYQPPQEEGRQADTTSVLSSFLSCLDALARCLCCLGPDISGNGEGGQRLLSAQAESHLAIEASAASPPRLPTGARSATEHGPLLKGQASSSSSLQPAASPPMPLPFFPPPPRPKRSGGNGGVGGGNGGVGGGSSGSPEGGSPKAAAAAAAAAGGKQQGKKGSKVSLWEDDEDVCPTCLDPYTEDNPRVLTRCGHHFHLPCLYEWLERSETCPVCGSAMQWDEIV